ncbi:MAG: hypothetical protein GOU99_03815 [Candidatus Altiarchaeota archaeon]|nr:hypothetical protein [Candidatus Altiarchaeota archaeon]
MYTETILAIVIGLFIVLWFSVRMRKGGRWIKERGTTGLGMFVLIFGALLLLISYLNPYLPQNIQSQIQPYVSSLITTGTWLAIVGALVLIFDQIYHSWKKGEGLKLEEEKREYIEGIRFGLTVDEAEKVAKDHIKKVTGETTKLVASKKEFKRWAVYLKDSHGKYFRVIINAKGKIEEWETMDEIPSYILSP